MTRGHGRRQAYDGLAICAPVTIPYRRYSTNTAQWWIGRALHETGYDYLHLSSGGNVAKASIPGGEPGYQLAFAEAVKQAVPDAVVMAVGMILTPAQAEDIVASGQADMVALARAVLDDPAWGHHAAAALGVDQHLPNQYARAGAAAWPGYGRIHA